jgi:hypothetical protein
MGVVGRPAAVGVAAAGVRARVAAGRRRHRVGGSAAVVVHVFRLHMADHAAAVEHLVVAGSGGVRGRWDEQVFHAGRGRAWRGAGAATDGAAA